jgi:glycosyltransferase involved in cell wall biosynthesis
MENQCVDLAMAFVQLGVEVAALVPESELFDPIAARVIAAGASVIRLDTDNRRGRAAQMLRLARLFGTLRKLRPDAVHVHTGGVTGGVAIAAAARLATDAAVVLTEHDAIFKKPGMRLLLANRAKDSFLHALIALSAMNVNLRRKWLGAPAGKFVFMRPGIHIADDVNKGSERERVRSELDIAPSAAVIGSAARFVPEKGLEDLVKAFAHVRREQPCRLLLVGDGPLRPRLEELARELSVEPDVHFAGFRSEPLPFLAAMDVFALASPVASGSIALLEAMALGLPAVITYCGPGEFLVPDQTGLCAPPSNPEGLGAVLLRLVRDPALRAKLGAGAAQHVRREFRMERVARDLLVVYDTARDRRIPGELLATSLAAR